MSSNELVLIDLSSIAYPIWHMSQSEPDPNRASQQIVSRVRALATDHPHAAICCDAGKSFRHDVSKEYKANRPEREDALHHQIKLATEQLAADGFPIWAVRGFEADDLVATATAKALALPELTVLIVSADKDLLQLVGPRVRAMSVRDGSILDAEAVGTKFGVTPTAMTDYLTLVGDSSDNIKGCRGIGPKKAAELLAKFGSLDSVYAGLERIGAATMGLPPAMVAALKEFKPTLETVRALVTLRTDVEIPFEEIAAERVAKAAADFGAEMDEAERWEPEPSEPTSPAPPAVSPATASGPHRIESPPLGSAAPPQQQGPGPGTAMAVREPDVLAAPPAEWERQLDPRSMQDARTLAKDMYASRMFSAYGSPQAVLATVMVGRELGLPAMSSLRNIHNIEGKHGLAASLMVALVLKSGLAEYFDPVEFDHLKATYETKRKGARKPIVLTHTIEMARTAQLLKPNSNWEKIPTDMLVARAQSRLARMVYPDLLAGLYTPEELQELREALRVA